MLLAIDTATQSLSLALHDGQRLQAELTLWAGRVHNQRLAPLVQMLLADSNTPTSALTAIAVCRGPGSYTGLRAGIALAKGIATTARLPLVGVDSLAILAAAAPSGTTRLGLLAAIEAGRGRIIAARYQWRGKRWQIADDAQITTWEALLTTLEAGSYLVTGEIDPEARPLLQAPPDGVTLTLLNGALRARRAGLLAELAFEQLDGAPAGAHLPAKLTPVYLKSPG